MDEYYRKGIPDSAKQTFAFRDVFIPEIANPKRASICSGSICPTRKRHISFLSAACPAENVYFRELYHGFKKVSRK
jgi:hypothetical protein